MKNLNSSLEAQSQKKVPPIQINVTAPVQGQEFRHIGNTATTGSFQNITHSHSNINHNNTSTNLSQHHLNINHTLHHPQNPNPKVQFHYQANQPPLLTPTYQNLTNIQYLPIVDNSQYSR